MEDKRLEFVAMMLAREEIQYLKPETIRKRVREASAAYDIMVEELGGAQDDEPAERNCTTCKYCHFSGHSKPCAGCLDWYDLPRWTPA